MSVGGFAPAGRCALAASSSAAASSKSGARAHPVARVFAEKATSSDGCLAAAAGSEAKVAIDRIAPPPTFAPTSTE